MSRHAIGARPALSLRPPALRLRPRAGVLPAALALALAAGTAAAAQEAADVWADLRTALGVNGFAVETAEEEIGEDAVRLEGLVLSTETQGEALTESGETVPSVTRIVVTIGDFSLVEEGDAVAVILPSEVPLRIETIPDGAPATTVSGRIVSEALDFAVSDAPGGGLRYVYAAESLSALVDEVSGEGATGDLSVALRIEELAGETIVGDAGGGRNSAQSQRAARLTVEAEFEDDDPVGGGTFAMALGIADLVATGGSRAPEGVELTDYAAAARAGATARAELSYGPSRLELAVNGAFGGFDVASASDGGAITAGLDAAGIAYGIETRGSRASARGDALPVPELAYAIGHTAIEVLVPILAGEAAQPFALGVVIADLDLDDALWALFDPGRVLPRDPATLDLDLSGTALLTRDLATAPDPEADADAAAPELRSLAIEGLSLSAAGAALNATGALTAEEGGTSAIPGLPALAGTIAIDVSGAEALLDGLVEMGLLPPERAAFARGMLGFVARPTGTDAYATEIELGADGSVTANGMPLQ